MEILHFRMEILPIFFKVKRTCHFIVKSTVENLELTNYKAHPIPKNMKKKIKKSKKMSKLSYSSSHFIYAFSHRKQINLNTTATPQKNFHNPERDTCKIIG